MKITVELSLQRWPSTGNPPQANPLNPCRSPVPSQSEPQPPQPPLSTKALYLCLLDEGSYNNLTCRVSLALSSQTQVRIRPPLSPPANRDGDTSSSGTLHPRESSGRSLMARMGSLTSPSRMFLDQNDQLVPDSTLQLWKLIIVPLVGEMLLQL